MARKKREKEPMFTEMHFDNAQYAMEVKQKSEKKLERCKIGLIIAAVAQVSWLLVYFIPMPDVISLPLLVIALGGVIASYIVGGGLGLALKATWKVAKSIGWFGWFCVPFPIDIFTGIALTMLALMMIPILFIFIPLGLVLNNYIQINKDKKAAEEYLKYCTPDNAAYGNGNVPEAMEN